MSGRFRASGCSVVLSSIDHLTIYGVCPSRRRASRSSYSKRNSNSLAAAAASNRIFCTAFTPGRGTSIWLAVQSLSQLEVVYGKARAQVLRDNMESQLYYRPTDVATARYVEERCGRRSAYAHQTMSSLLLSLPGGDFANVCAEQTWRIQLLLGQFWKGDIDIWHYRKLSRELTQQFVNELAALLHRTVG